MDINRINKIWDEKKENLVKPKIVVAIDKENKGYYVIKDSTSIVFLIYKNSNITYSIPKKYLKEEFDYYIINDSERLITVSCPTKKDAYETFVQKYLMSK